MSGEAKPKEGDFKVEMKVSVYRGEDQYGPDWNSLAEFDVPADYGAIRVFQEALARLTEPRGVLTMSSPLTEEEANELREKWKKEYR